MVQAFTDVLEQLNSWNFADKTDINTSGFRVLDSKIVNDTKGGTIKQHLPLKVVEDWSGASKFEIESKNFAFFRSRHDEVENFKSVKAEVRLI